MSANPEIAALLALLRLGRRPSSRYSELIEEGRTAGELLERELHEGEHGQTTLTEPSAAPSLIRAATDELTGWTKAGIMITTVLDPGYPTNLRMVHDRPPLIFVAGRMRPRDQKAIAIIGTRHPSSNGIEKANQLAAHLAEHQFTVISGLARGIDAAVHTTTLERNGRTIAVIGTGLQHAYPPENAALQAEIAARGAVISQFWPEAGPTKTSFPARNALMSGLALATVIVEASLTSGTRVQARKALAHGRPVFLERQLMTQPWASELAAKPGTYVYDAPEQIVAQTERLTQSGSVVG